MGKAWRYASGMKVTISIPDSVVEAAEHLAKRLGKSRRELYAEAVSEYLSAHKTDTVTDKLNVVYAAENPSLDPVLEKTQMDRLEGEGW